MQYQICEGSHNAKVSQLDPQHEVSKVPKRFGLLCITWKKMWISFIDVPNVKFIILGSS